MANSVNMIKPYFLVNGPAARGAATDRPQPDHVRGLGCLVDGEPRQLTPRTPELWDRIPLVARVENFANCFYVGFHCLGYGLKSFSTFAFTAASILMSGGHSRLKPSPGSFAVASMPSLLPAANSLVA